MEAALPGPRTSLCLLLFCAVFALGRGAAAQTAQALEPPPTGAADEQAQHLSDEGLVAYKAGQFADAVRLYRQAYGLRAEPALLYNLAKAYEKLGQRDNAVEYYRRYLVSEGTDPKLRQRAEERVAALAAPGSSPKGKGGAALTPPPKKEPPPPGRTWLYTGIGLGAVGVAGLAVGIGLYVPASAAHDEYVASRDELDKRAARDRAQALGTGSAVSYAVGGALLLGGAALVGYGLYKGRAARARSAAAGTASTGLDRLRAVLVPLPSGAAAVFEGGF